MNPFKRRLRTVTLMLAAALGLAALPIYGYKIATKDGYSDFDVYYRAARQSATGDWAGVYAFHEGADTPFRYGPPFLLAFRPLASLDFGAARLGWFFLQYLCFGAGFYFLFRALRRITAETGRDPLWLTAAALLFSLRFCLDCFTIGQATSVMFLGFTASLDAWLARRPGRAAGALFVPSIIKVGPALLFVQYALSGRREGLRTLTLGALVFALSAAAVALWAGPTDGAGQLWVDWVKVVLHDSSYFDASHYGSQSVKSALLRLAHAGWFSPELAARAALGAAVVGIGALVAFWKLRPAAEGAPRSPGSTQAADASRPAERFRAEALMFSLGIMAYLLFMPETFKYSLPLLAIPVAVLLAGPLGRFEWTAFAFGALTLSLAGLDIVGETLFFGMQKASVPLLALLVLSAALGRQAWAATPPKA